MKFILKFVIVVATFFFGLSSILVVTSQPDDGPEWNNCTGRLPSDLSSNYSYICCNQILRCRCIEAMCCPSSSASATPSCVNSMATSCDFTQIRCSDLTDDKFPAECKGHRPDEISAGVPKPTNCATPTPVASTSTGHKSNRIWIAVVVVGLLVVLAIIIALIYCGTSKQQQSYLATTSKGTSAGKVTGAASASTSKVEAKQKSSSNSKPKASWSSGRKQ